MVIVTGFKEVDNLMRRLPKELSHKVVGAALYKAAQPIERGARARIKSKTGNLYNSIGTVRQSFKKATEVGEVRVGPRIGGGQKGYHGHLVEFGAKNRPPGGWYARFRNAHNTTSKPHPFLKPAFDANKDDTISQINANIGTALRNAMRRHLKKQGAWNG
jgi:HK97 gp10 family phage protein